MELSRYSIGKITVVVLVVLSFHNSVYSQDLTTRWGPLETSKGAFLDLMPMGSSDFYTLRNNNGILGSYAVTLHNELSFTEKQKIRPVTETGFSNVDGSLFFGNDLLIFLSDRMNGQMSFYSQTLTENIQKELPILRLSYEDDKIGAKPNFNVSASQNRKFFVVYYEIEGRKENRDLYGYAIYDSTVTQISTGTFILPFEGNLSTINEHHLTNDGEYIVVVTEHLDRNDRFFGKEYENFKAIHIYKINGETPKEFSVNLDNKRIDDIMVTSNENHKLALTGLYGSGRLVGIEGVFTINLDLNLDSVTAYKYSPFSRDILKESRTNQQMNRYEQRQENRGLEPQTYAYKLRQIQSLADGTQVGCMEQYYTQRYPSYDSRTGVTTINYYYYFMDIVAFKLLENGSFAWEKRIPKYQVSLNDNGPYSSFISFNNEKKLYLIFNDNPRNYDEGEQFRSEIQNPYGMNLLIWKNVAAMTEIDISTGNMERRIWNSSKDIASIVVPKMMKVDWKNKSLWLYATNKNREKFGTISFK